jgi:hypothetical protein
VKLARLLPDSRASDLLAGLLLDGAAARDAWRRWTDAAGDVKSALAANARSFLPLVYDSVRRNALPVDQDTATYLKSACLTESVRSRAYRDIVDDLSARWRDKKFVLIKGAAVGPMFYADPALRHAHDIEVLVEQRSDLRSYIHDSGLPVRIHRRLPIPNFESVDATNALALALVHAARSLSRHTGRWACDAVMIVRSGRVDWPRFVDLVEGSSVSTHAQLVWLRDMLNVDVPDSVIAALIERSSRLERVATALRLRASSVRLLRRLWR